MNKHSILIAEDDADDRYLMKTALEETGVTENVVYVENGVEVITYLEKITKENTKNGTFVGNASLQDRASCEDSRT